VLAVPGLVLVHRARPGLPLRDFRPPFPARLGAACYRPCRRRRSRMGILEAGAVSPRGTSRVRGRRRESTVGRPTPRLCLGLPTRGAPMRRRRPPARLPHRCRRCRRRRRGPLRPAAGGLLHRRALARALGLPVVAAPARDRQLKPRRRRRRSETVVCPTAATGSAALVVVAAS